MSKMRQMLLTRSAPFISNPAYANVLTAIMGDLWSAMDVVSRELVGFIPSVTRNASDARGAVGQSITYPITPDQTATDIVPAMTPPSGYDNTFAVGTMALTKAKAVKFNFTGEEQRALNVTGGPNFLSAQSMIFAGALRELTNLVEIDVAAAAAAGASRAYGTAGTTPFGSGDLTDIAQVRKILDDNGAPASMRSLILNTTAGAKLRALSQLTKVNEAGSQMQLRDGVILDVFNFGIKESAAAVRHVKGTGASATTNAAGYAVGATTITLASAGTGTITAGDVVTFAGDTNKYVVATGDADVSNGGTIVLQEPGLLVAIAASATAITVGNTYDANVAFSSDAIHLAMRAPDAGTHDLAVDSVILTDPRSGISFDVRIYEGYRMMYGEVGLAWGVKATKPQHIAMLLG